MVVQPQLPSSFGSHNIHATNDTLQTVFVAIPHLLVF